MSQRNVRIFQIDTMMEIECYISMVIRVLRRREMYEHLEFVRDLISCWEKIETENSTTSLEFCTLYRIAQRMFDRRQGEDKSPLARDQNFLIFHLVLSAPVFACFVFTCVSHTFGPGSYRAVCLAVVQQWFVVVVSVGAANRKNRRH